MTIVNLVPNFRLFPVENSWNTIVFQIEKSVLYFKKYLVIPRRMWPVELHMNILETL